MTTPLRRLSEEFQQSPWLDNLTRAHVRNGTLTDLISRGVRGLTSNPTIFQKAIEGSPDYDEQFSACVHAGGPIEAHYWDLVVTDIIDACDAFMPVYDSSRGRDGFVSLEVDPRLAHDTTTTVQAAHDLAGRIARPNLMIKVPGTPEGLPAVRALVAQGFSINVTLIFSVERYCEVLEAYISGLEDRHREMPGSDLSSIGGVASFFVSRTDTAVDAQLDALGSPAAAALRGTAALTQARLAYQEFQRVTASDRWAALAAHGAQVQRPLWASTGTKNPSYSDVMYVEGLIGPQTVNTMPEPTLVAFEDHGAPRRTIDNDPDADARTWAQLLDIGVDPSQVATTLEHEGIEAFQRSFTDLIAALAAKAEGLL